MHYNNIKYTIIQKLGTALQHNQIYNNTEAATEAARSSIHLKRTPP